MRKQKVELYEKNSEYANVTNKTQKEKAKTTLEKCDQFVLIALVGNEAQVLINANFHGIPHFLRALVRVTNSFDQVCKMAEKTDGDNEN